MFIKENRDIIAHTYKDECSENGSVTSTPLGYYDGQTNQPTGGHDGL